MSRTASGCCEGVAHEARSSYMAAVCACAPTHSTLLAQRPSTSKAGRSRSEVIRSALIRTVATFFVEKGLSLIFCLHIFIMPPAVWYSSRECVFKLSYGEGPFPSAYLATGGDNGHWRAAESCCRGCHAR